MILLAAATSFGFAGPAQAAASSVTISGPATAQSGTTQTYTLSVTCSGTCGDTTVTFPTNAITGDGPTTDFGSWVGAGTCSTLTVSGGQVTVTYPNLGSGSTSCNFTVKPPEYTSFNGAKITMTPTMTTTSAGSVAGSPVTLTVSAGHNDTLTKTAAQQVSSGAGFTYTLLFNCGANGGFTGDVGLSALTITDPLPANFTYQSSSTPGLSLPGTLSYSAAANTLTYSDPTGKSCGNPPLSSSTGNVLRFAVTGSATTNGSPDPANTQICNTATATFTYLDGTDATSTPPTVCSTVVSIAWNNTKVGTAVTTTNNGQYKFPGSNTLYSYTYPGDWDGTGTSSEFDVHLAISTQATTAGLAYAVQDPLPCLDNFAGNVYTSNAPGTLCQHPAFIPTRVLVQGFTPNAADPADVVTVRFADGTTQDVAYSSGSWTIPTSKPVAQLDFPAFPEEGSNFGNIALRIQGYAAPTTATTSLLNNTETANAYPVGSTTPVSPPQTASGSLLVVSATAPSGMVINSSLTSSSAGNCTENVQLNNPANGNLANYIEIASAPSAAITVDYLAPTGATGVSGWTGTWKLTGNSNGKTFTTASSLTPTTTPDYGGSGRTLYEWVIPAGTVTTGGVYKIVPPNSSLNVDLGPGCAGTYDNDVTVGYATGVTSCVTIATGKAQTPPLNPTADNDLNANGAGGSNYCGRSAPVTVPAVNPAYTVDKVVQGNLDAVPVGGGGIGHVSPTGGTATYTLSFTNTGQSNLTNPVLYDLLPRVGDTEASSTAARNSKFAVTLTGIGAVPAGITVYYSQATNPCRPEVLTNASNPGCINDWSATAPASLSSVTALKFVYTGTVYVGGSSAGIHGFTVPYTVSTPTTAVGNVAWNSVGTSVFAGDNRMPPAESAYTGLAAQASQPLVTKAANTSAYSKAGDPITYTFTVTNNTAVTLSPVTLTDRLTDAATGDAAPAVICQALSSPSGACSGASTSLAPNQVATFTATYPVNQADLDHGLITDQATATAQPPTGGALVNSSNPVTVTAVQSPALSLTKSALPVAVSAVGDQVTYSFLVTNSGNVTVSNIGVQDNAFSGSGTVSAPSCPNGTLAPGAQETCTAAYSVTQADLNAGSITNTAHAEGTGAGGAAVTSSDSSATVSVTQAPALSLVKSADPSSPAAYTAGQVITYHYLVTNTGNVTVTSVGIGEDSFTGSGSLSSISCPTSTLTPNAQVDCTAIYTLTQADIDAGSISNTATARGTAPGADVSSAPSTVATPATPNPAMTLAKSVLPATVATVGDDVAYSYQVTNTGNVTISAVAIEETAFSGSGTPPAPTCPITTLVPGQQTTCTASYTVTQADIDAGSVTNTADATGIAANSAPVTSNSSNATLTATQSPALSLAKSADPAGPSAFSAGQQITYRFLVTNTGNVTITGVAINEGTFTGDGTLSATSCSTTALAPGDHADCTATYALTQHDVDAGSVDNTATATGSPPSGPAIDSNSSTATVIVTADPGLTLVKSADVTTVSKAGDPVKYGFLVTNTGNVTIGSLAIEETAFSGSGTLGAPTCARTALLPGEQTSCTISYAITQPDIDAGSVTNTADAVGQDPSGASVASPPSSALVSATQSPALTLTKSANPASVAEVGAKVTYTFTVENAGNVSLTEITIREGAFSGRGKLTSITCPATSLAPGGRIDCTTTYAVTQSDLDAGSVTNTATASALDPAGDPITSPESSATVGVRAKPALTLAKTATPTTVTKAGRTITYRFAITNTGNLTLRDVTVRETRFTGSRALTAITCPNTSLAPNQHETCTARYTVTSKDLTAARISNTAVAAGRSELGGHDLSVRSAASTALVRIQAPATGTTSRGGSGTTGTGGSTAHTGVDVLALAAAAVTFILAGGFAVVTGRRRRET